MPGRMPQPARIDANVNLNTAPPGSAIEQYWQRMLALAPTPRQSGLAEAGSILGAMAGDRRDNRVIQGNAQQGYDATRANLEANRNQTGLAAQLGYDTAVINSNKDRRDSESDAMQKIQQAAHLQRGDRSTDVRTGAASYNPNASEQAAAGALSQQMMDRLNAPQVMPTRFTPDNSFMPADPSTYAKPGTMEQIGSWGGGILGGIGALDKITGGKSGDYLSNLLGKVPGISKFLGGNSGFNLASLGGGGGAGSLAYGASAPPGMANAGGLLSKFGLGGGAGAGNILGKAVPIAGAVTGGIGLMKNRGLISNLMNGVSTGASIGSVVPGLGTAIGAGIGGLVGGIRTLFGGSPKPRGPIQTAPGQYRVN